MKFECTGCKETKCCDNYMEQVITEEYEGLTTNIQRNEGDDKAFKSNLTN